MPKENLILDEEGSVIWEHEDWRNRIYGERTSYNQLHNTQRKFEEGVMNLLNAQLEDELRLSAMRREMKERNLEMLKIKQRFDKWEISRKEFDKIKQEFIDWLHIQKASI